MSPKAARGKKEVAAKKALTVDVYDLDGKKTSTRALPETVFNVSTNPVVIAQAVRYYRSRMQAGTAAAKDRSQVTGSGRKIWAQKHTGRARHADRQAPTFVGGGRAHGPKPHRMANHFTHHLRHLALRACLTQKLKDNQIAVIALPKLEKPSTKLFKSLPTRVGLTEGSSLYVFEPEAKAAYFSIRNLPRTDGRRALSLTAYDVLRSRNLVLTEKAVDLLAQRLAQA